MEIEVGDFVRTKRGKIFQYGKGRAYLGKNNSIVKHSKILSEVVEVGDYVNGYPVRRIPNFNNELCNFDLNTMEWTPLKDIDVYYNILTKEQYMQNCYKIDTN